MYADRLFNALERNEPGPGQLLIAAPGMMSPEFARSVVLMIQEDVGVVLNNRSEVAVFNVLPEWVDIVAAPQALYIGGPVNQQSVVGLAMTKPDVKSHPELRFLAPRLAYVDLRAEPPSDAVVGMRLFAGLAQWAPGQLASEIQSGDWYVAPALAQDVITPGAADLWSDVMKRQPMPLPLYSTFPANVGSN